MNTLDVRQVIDDALEGRRLLEHPFYRRWEAGELADGELAAYAAQYRHIEAALPDLLAAIASTLEDGPARRAVEDNLADELGSPAPHLQLLEAFADGVGAGRDDATPATRALVDTQRRLAAAGPVSGLSALAAYEAQSPAIAASKASGLRRWYGLDGAAVEFWDVHAGMDTEHAAWTMQAIAELAVDADEVQGPARVSADVWWAFLDEREAAAPALV